MHSALHKRSLLVAASSDCSHLCARGHTDMCWEYTVNPVSFHTASQYFIVILCLKHYVLQEIIVVIVLFIFNAV